MKKLILLLAIQALMVAISGCESFGAKFANPQQQEFDNFLSKKKKISQGLSNDIQKKEFYNQFEKDLFNYVDSVKLFVNWKGQIKEIKTKESGQVTIVEFKIYYKPEENREVVFQCINLVLTENLESNHIYNQVKNMSNYSPVFFDGFIRTDNNNQVYYEGRSPGNERNVSYPNYYFWIIDIGAEKRNNSHSVNMQNAIDYCFKIVEPQRMQFRNQISKEESNKMYNEMLPEFENLKSRLTEDERLYIQRIYDCSVSNIISK